MLVSNGKSQLKFNVLAGCKLQAQIDLVRYCAIAKEIFNQIVLIPTHHAELLWATIVASIFIQKNRQPEK